MAHFAKLDDKNIVTQVIVVDNDDITDNNGNETESLGVAFCQKFFGADTTWKQTYYNNNVRGNYAGIGATYMSNVATLGVASTDIFIEQQPFPSWSIGINTATWYSPLGDDITGPGITSTVELDNDGKSYVWDESLYQSDNTKGWVLK